MRQVSRLVMGLSAVAGLAMLTPAAKAVVILNAGGTQSSIVADTNFEPSGATLAAGPLVVPGTTTDSGAFTLTEEVFKEVGGTYDFLFQLKNTGTATAISSLSPSSYTSFATSVGYETSTPTGFSAGTVGTSTISRGATGSVLTYNFTSGLASGATSDVFVAQTNATAFNQNGSASLVDTAGTGSITSIYQPATGVPEPASALVAVVPLGAYLLRRRRVQA